MKRYPRLLIAAPSSGAGKTSWTLGLLRLFARRGVRVQAFKAGPDYIDPALHALVSGRPSRNLDTRLLSAASVRSGFLRAAADADLSVAEGAMGFFDGAGPGDPAGSAARLADLLAVPTLLVLDVGSSGASAGAVALGFQRYKRPSRIVGFLLNRVGSERHRAAAAGAVEAATGLPVFGCLPKDPLFSIPERHLGLSAGDGNDALLKTADMIADALERQCDIDALIRAADAAGPPPGAAAAALRGKSPRRLRARIAVARDRAFWFYYEDNFDLLREAGAELLPFSPLEDAALPSGADAVYIGGGYPELYASELAANRSMKDAVRRAAESGMPMLAECGGYMYLTEAVADADGTEAAMVGLLPGRAVMGRRRAALGYYGAEVLEDSFYASRGERLSGHCFRYSTVEFPENAPAARRGALRLSKDGEAGFEDGTVYRNVFASYLHVHFGSNPRLAARFVRAAAAFRRKR